MQKSKDREQRNCSLGLKNRLFTAPASTKYHGSIEEGLVMHSLNVYEMFHEEVLNRAKGIQVLIPLTMRKKKKLQFVHCYTIFAK